MSVSASTGGSLGVSVSDEDKHRTKVPAGIKATQSLKVQVGDTLYLIGGVLDGPAGNTTVEAKQVVVQHLSENDESHRVGVNIQLPSDKWTLNKDDAVWGAFDFDFEDQEWRGTTQATLSPEANLQVTKVTDDLKNLNRVMDHRPGNVPSGALLSPLKAS